MQPILPSKVPNNKSNRLVLLEPEPLRSHGHRHEIRLLKEAQILSNSRTSFLANITKKNETKMSHNLQSKKQHCSYFLEKGMYWWSACIPYSLPNPLCLYPP
ncbi:hypothetical protein Ahy_A05g023118 isoform D [Arachis hypogaea]|uniref:Uncharacterized protein n=1 Tax=Arachis hypogaea TaxID=3818 RepID=A0A445D2E2_ARAHY|nr:hypothetical protein Ahy_A05g023118 isoform D [Arachis hypogaea]